MTDYNIDPDDPGIFVENWKIRDYDKSSDKGITTLDKPKDFLPLKFFVMVGGGYRGYKKKVNANRYYKQD